MGSDGGHCSFVLLAEFDILLGAQLKYQFPQPLGVDESVLAMSMLPDGAETQLDDWTVFFLNQTAFNTISPVLALDTPEVKTTPLLGEGSPGSQGDKPDLLCVLNLVRTKHDKTLDRGARVLALAICTRHPFIQIFKPVLLMALDDYLADPSQDCLARLFDAVNSMDLSGAPLLSRNEKMVMRSSERKDIFAEKISTPAKQSWNNSKANLQHKATQSAESFSSFEEGILMRSKEREELPHAPPPPAHSTAQSSPSEASFSLGGSAVWVGEESGTEGASAEDGEVESVMSYAGTAVTGATNRRRRSTDASSASSHMKDGMLRPSAMAAPSYMDASYRGGMTKDTHFYHTTVQYKDHHLPIKMPLATFPEEVGDYSLITLVKAFSNPNLVTGPFHPHLHTNGQQTHPIILLFNALVTGKRIIFLGHKKPAGEVSSFVLSACALGSGCGAVLRGFIERAFPYANLNNRDEWEAVPAFIAGVTNPIFKSSPTWDLLLDISTGSVTVARDIHAAHPVSTTFAFPGIARTATFNPETSLPSEENGTGAKTDFLPKADHNADNIFMEEIKAAIEYHYGESLVRIRFTEYVLRFVRLASRYEEDSTGSTKFGYPSSGFDSRLPNPRLGSGIVFNDDAAGRKELAANSQRIEGWRKTNSFEYACADFRNSQLMDSIQGFDVSHQLFRIRHAKNMSDAEITTIMKTLAESVKTYDQVVELLAYLMPHGGGLLHLAFALFHQKETVRDAAVDLFNQLRAFPVGVMFLQALNHFQRYAYVRQAHARERRLLEQQQQPKLYGPPSTTPTVNGVY
ncbi:unnamed protein product [Mycena citricolor]|uniref:UDENN domain-containing protein n=1 Tax=Mycena citricolor TaxID=2018698 RepID=A0AAD2HU71_9AGAR|nr:unnamed protein product [Mycena citricolor]CAK5281164.1 unnamed protein product [Mycena citricolor]